MITIPFWSPSFFPLLPTLIPYLIKLSPNLNKIYFIGGVLEKKMFENSRWKALFGEKDEDEGIFLLFVYVHLILHKYVHR